MKLLIGLGLIAAAFAWGAWYWRKNYVPSPLEVHLADLDARSAIGTIVSRQHFFARPAWTTVAEGPLTATRINPNNPASICNRPGKLNLYPRSPTRV